MNKSQCHSPVKQKTKDSQQNADLATLFFSRSERESLKSFCLWFKLNTFELFLSRPNILIYCIYIVYIYILCWFCCPTTSTIKIDIGVARMKRVVKSWRLIITVAPLGRLGKQKVWWKGPGLKVSHGLICFSGCKDKLIGAVSFNVVVKGYVQGCHVIRMLYPVSYVEMLGKKRRCFFSFLMERNARWNRWDARNTGIFIRFLKLCEQWGLLIDVLGMPMRLPGDFDEKLQWWETAEMMGVSQNNEANKSIGFPLKMHDFTIWEYGVT